MGLRTFRISFVISVLTFACQTVRAMAADATDLPQMTFAEITGRLFANFEQLGTLLPHNCGVISAWAAQADHGSIGGAVDGGIDAEEIQ